LQILLFTIEVGTDLKPDPIRIKKIKGMNCWRNHQERPRIYTDPICFQSLQYLAEPPRPAGERDVLHRANRVAINLGNSFRIFKESEQTVAAHIKKIMGNVCVGRRTIPVRVACARRARRRSEAMHDRHAEHAYIKIERHPHAIGNEREVMDAAQ
jgi:hypothetical protein